jgi:hypothetical protein
MRIIIVFMTLILVSCAAKGTYYQGATVEQDIVQLPAVAAEYTWQDLYLTVDYALSRQDNRLRIEGNLSFSLFSRINLAWANDVVLSLYLLDDQGVVLSYQDIASTLGSRLDSVIPFRKDIPIGNAVTAIWFGYEGKFLKEKGEGIDYVWKRPKLSS